MLIGESLECKNRNTEITQSVISLWICPTANYGRNFILAISLVSKSTIPKTYLPELKFSNNNANKIFQKLKKKRRYDS